MYVYIYIHTYEIVKIAIPGSINISEELYITRDARPGPIYYKNRCKEALQGIAAPDYSNVLALLQKPTRH